MAVITNLMLALFIMAVSMTCLSVILLYDNIKSRKDLAREKEQHNDTMTILEGKRKELNLIRWNESLSKRTGNYGA